MDNFDFNESAYIAEQPRTTENDVFAPATDSPFADAEYTVEDGDLRPSPVLTDGDKADKTPENGDLRPEPRRKHPHRRGEKGGAKDGNRSEGKGKHADGDGTDGEIGRKGTPHGKGDGNAPSDGHRPVPLPYFPEENGNNRPAPLPYFPENDGNSNPETRPAPYRNDGAEQTERTERAEHRKYTEHAGRKNALSDGASRPLSQGGLADKIVARATTETENAATAVALDSRYVAGARAIETADGVLVAVLLDPVFLASERRGLKETLREAVENATGAPAVVTYDLGVYRNIRPDMSEDAKAALYAAATARN